MYKNNGGTPFCPPLSEETLSFSSFRKKVVATPNSSVEDMRNLDFLSMGAFPTGTKWSLIFDGGDWLADILLAVELLSMVQ